MPSTWSLRDVTAGVDLGTFLSRARANTAAEEVEEGHAWTMWELTHAARGNGELADEGVGPLRDPVPDVVSSYRIECVVRPSSPAEHRRHLTGIRTVDADGSERHWDSIAIVREAIRNGDVFFT